MRNDAHKPFETGAARGQRELDVTGETPSCHDMVGRTVVRGLDCRGRGVADKQFWNRDSRGGDVVQSVEHRTGTLPTQVRFPGAAKDFSPRVNCQCRL